MGRQGKEQHFVLSSIKQKNSITEFCPMPERKHPKAEVLTWFGPRMMRSARPRFSLYKHAEANQHSSEYDLSSHLHVKLTRKVSIIRISTSVWMVWSSGNHILDTAH